MQQNIAFPGFRLSKNYPVIDVIYRYHDRHRRCCFVSYLLSIKLTLLRAGACAIDNGGCHQNASCTLTVGGNVECSCNQCFEGDGLNCTRTYWSTSQNAALVFVGVSVQVFLLLFSGMHL